MLDYNRLLYLDGVLLDGILGPFPGAGTGTDNALVRWDGIDFDRVQECPNVICDDNGFIGIGETSPETLLELTSTAPYITLHNSTEENGDGGRESQILFKGEQDGSEETTLAKIQASHDGTADDQKGDLILYTNDGSDGNSPTERMRIDSSGNVGIGTTEPTNTLEINGGLFLNGDAADTPPRIIKLGPDNDGVHTYICVPNDVSAGNDFNYNGYFSGVAEVDVDTTKERVAMSLGRSGHALKVYTAETDGESHTNTGNKFVIEYDGKVGIGEVAPETLLELTSTAPYITLHNSTEENGDGGRESQILFKGEQSGGEETTLAKIQASHDGTADDQKGDLIFYTNDGSDGDAPTERVRIDSAGNVGIGTTSPGTNLQVGDVDIGVSETGVWVTDADANSVLRVGQGRSNNAFVGWVYNATPADAYFAVGTYGGGNDLALMGSGGNVGIGEVAPETLLELTSTAPYITLHNSTEEDGDGGRESQILFKGEQSGGEETTLAKIQASHDGAADDQKGDLIFYTNDGSDGDAPTERMRIDSSGNVGIGTTAPSHSLVVSGGDVKVTKSGAPLLYLERIDANINTDEGLGAVYFSGTDPAVNSVGAVVSGLAAGTWSTGNTPASLRFFTVPSGSSSLTERMRLFSSGGLAVGDSFSASGNDPGADNLIIEGNVGIGTTGPGFKLEVQGGTDNTVAMFNSTDDYSIIGFKDGSTGTNYPAIGAHGDDLRIGVGGSERVRIDSNGNVGISEQSPETLLELTSTAPYITLHNSTEEDGDGGRESQILFKGEQSGGEETTLAKIQASHDGADDDEKGDLIFYTNDGSDGDAPTERVRMDSSGNVGIGTTSPDSKITINQSADSNGIRIYGYDDKSSNYADLFIRSDGYVQLKNDASGGRVYIGNTDGRNILEGMNQLRDDKSLVLGTDNDYALVYSNTDDSLQFVDGQLVDTNVRMVIDTDGNVGIGTTDIQNWAAGQTALQLGGQSSFMTETSEATNAAFQITLNAYYDGSWKYQAAASNEAANYYMQNGQHFWRVAGAGTADNVITWTQAMKIDNDGNVGIGELAPETLLELTSTTPYITLHNSTEEDGDGGRESKFLFKGEQSGGEETTLASIVAAHDGGADDQKGYIQFATNDGDDSNSPTLRVEIDSTGSTKLGDGGTTNYAEIKSDGEINLHGTARVKSTEWISAEGIGLPNTNPADEVDYGIGLALEFGDEAINYENAKMRIKVPKDIDTSVQPILIIGWSCPTADPGDDSVQVRWELQYLWRAANEVMDAAAEATVTDNYTTSETAKGLVVTEIQLANFGASDVCFTAQIARRSDNAGDTANGVAAHLHGVCLYYTRNKLGEAT